MGYIYIIKCNITGEYYIGSTRNLAKRMKGHRCPSNKTGSKAIIERGDYNVEVLEEIDEGVDLAYREQEYMENMRGDGMLNRISAMRSEYENALDHYERNRQPMECECGLYIRANHLARHRRSNIHADRMAEM